MTENKRELNELFQTDVYLKIVPMIHDLKFIYQIGLDGFHVQIGLRSTSKGTKYVWKGD